MAPDCPMHFSMCVTRSVGEDGGLEITCGPWVGTVVQLVMLTLWDLTGRRDWSQRRKLPPALPSL